MPQVIETVRNIIRQRFEQELEAIVADLRDELNQQGHHATGSLEKSLTFEIKYSDSEGFLGTIFGNDYAFPLNTGVPANRVPYGKGSGRGGTSKYITALLQWAETVRPELDEKSRKSFVFAVAKNASKEGHPTRGSFSFSRNGDRKNFINKVFDKHVNALVAKIGGRDLSDKIAASMLKESGFVG